MRREGEVIYGRNDWKNSIGKNWKELLAIGMGMKGLGKNWEKKETGMLFLFCLFGLFFRSAYNLGPLPINHNFESMRNNNSIFI